MEDYVFFILMLIISLPITYWAFMLMFRWVDFMSSLKAKSFFYTKFGFRFKTVERIQDFGAYIIAVVFTIFTILTAFPYLLPSIILLF